MAFNLLWADDEIELLKPHIMFLEEKGYRVDTVTSGNDAIDHVQTKDFDIVFLDENMPGLNGLETLVRIKELIPDIPVVMITKSEEEAIMEEAIGSKISDYLIKPVNPNQILLTLKKNLDDKRLVSEKTTSGYQQEFRQIGMQLSSRMDHGEWAELYRKIVHWDLELEGSEEESMDEIFQMQKAEANQQFGRFIEKNYLDWVSGDSESAPIMSHTLFKHKVAPMLKEGPVYLLLIDNLRFDQWRTIRPQLSELFRIEEEDMYYSILPTATQYSRNAIFSGLMPSEMEKLFPDLWLNDEDEGGKNMHEQEFLHGQLKRLGLDKKIGYNKITNLSKGKKLVDNFNNLTHNDLNVIVYNFVDMLSHARTEMEVIRELADNEAAYRSLTLSWFEHSALYNILQKIADTGAQLIITTDHGTVHVKNPVKIVGDRNVNSNLRYKRGRNLGYDASEVFEVQDPGKAGLPRQNVSTRFVFAKESDFFAYPNNYNHYVRYYKDTFQHGGISLEEMLIPCIKLKAK
ncbi:MAG: bifunctional response regulator/alkaline phosphatase family protein [Flavobacteriales bacterium]|nr:bifunctional response regulator/alkaline phosphatase family protein [Flavobacteriales bacterium]